MSQAVIPPRDTSRPSFSRRRGRLMRPAVSLIAQGEPMVWLSGGAIMICITMILGLLFLVLWNGLPTFWPAPLTRFERIDGKVALGEVFRSESFVLTRDSVHNLSGQEAVLAEKLLHTTEQLPVRRRLVRTGNFELTSEHFQWINDFAIRPQGESRPRWGVTVERLEWGRFYGEPQRFTRRHLRTPTAEEQELADIEQFFAAQRWRLTPEQTDPFEKALAPLAVALQVARSKSASQFLAPFTPASQAPIENAANSSPQIEVILADGQIASPANHDPNQLITEVRETWTGAESSWEQFTRYHAETRRRSKQRYRLEQHEIGQLNQRMESARLKVREQELEHGVAAVDLAAELKTFKTAIQLIQEDLERSKATIAKLRTRFSQQPSLLQFATQFVEAQQADCEEQLREPLANAQRIQASLQELPEPVRQEVSRFVEVQLVADRETAGIQKQITDLNDENSRYELTMVTADGQEKALSLSDIVRAYPANQLTLASKIGVYLSRWHEFLTDEPREANSEGGVFPAIWGTVVMTLVMSLLVVPFGVLAALYLREYARAGFIVSAIRISISNLAGVPSIVFGVFGLGFFCYVFGSLIDGGPRNAGLVSLPPRAWWFVLTGFAVGGIAAIGCWLVSLSGGRGESRRSYRWLRFTSFVLWLACFGMGVVLLFGSPYFHGLFATALPNPTFGKGGVLWASLTLALMTLPVVIVATEEAISAVPNSLREGSYACGASKWQTILRIVIPHAMPGIMTGMILAMARGAGEVAPLMLVGAVKLAPDLPIDSVFPFVHLDRSFMHLGFHIFDVGFQSQNSEAAKPMVFTTTLLLILVIAMLNLTAVWIRSKLRKRYLGGQF